MISLLNSGDYTIEFDDNNLALVLNVTNIKTYEKFNTKIENSSPMFERHKIITNNDMIRKLLNDGLCNNGFAKPVSVDIRKCEDVTLGKIFISISVNLKYIEDNITIYLQDYESDDAKQLRISIMLSVDDRIKKLETQLLEMSSKMSDKIGKLETQLSVLSIGTNDKTEIYDNIETLEEETNDKFREIRLDIEQLQNRLHSIEYK